MVGKLKRMKRRIHFATYLQTGDKETVESFSSLIRLVRGKSDYGSCHSLIHVKVIVISCNIGGQRAV